MLAFLGWNPGTSKELYSMEELIQDFSLERVGKSGAKFDPEKTKWFNQQHLRAKSNNELAKMMKEISSRDVSIEHFEKVAELMKERAVFTEELLSDNYFFESPTEFDEKTFRKKWKERSGNLMSELFALLEKDKVFSTESIEKIFKDFIEEKEVGMGAVLPCLRLILTGKGMGPSVFAIASLLGKQEVMERFKSKNKFFVDLYKAKVNP